jgi:hypothetical protein
MSACRRLTQKELEVGQGRQVGVFCLEYRIEQSAEYGMMTAPCMQDGFRESRKMLKWYFL